MSKLGWLGFTVLVVNTLLACWVAWQRHSLASELDATTPGTIVTVHEGSGRAPNDRLVASYTLGGKTYTVQGNSGDDDSLTVKQHPMGSTIMVHVSSKNAAVSSLSSRGHGLGLVTGTAGLLLLATMIFAYFAFIKRS